MNSDPTRTVWKLSFGLLLLILVVCSSGNAQEPLGKLNGIVVDWQYARVLRTTIVFETAGLRKAIQVDEEGAYEVELPAGWYTIKATAPGFIERRVKLQLESATPRILNLMLDVRPQKVIRCPKGSLCL
jgi:hypothetical protein